MLKDYFSGFTSAIAGLSKNAGKTTLLSALIAQTEEKIAVTSIGLDGENTDAVTLTPKPRLYIKRGTILVTAQQAFDKCDITKRILDVTDIGTPLGRVIVAEALSDGFVLLAGPSMYSQAVSVRDKLRQWGVSRFYVDGAVSRRAFATAELCDSLAFCVGASYSFNFERIIEETRHIVRILTLPVARDGVKISGALGNAEAEKVIRVHAGRAILLEDPGKILFGKSIWDKAQACGCTFAVERRAELCLVAVNPYSAYGTPCDADKLLTGVRRAVPENIPVCDVKRGVII